jgi:uncharacterized membrane protein
MKFITRNFFQGVLVLGPLLLTAYIFKIFFVFFDKMGRDFLGLWVSREAVFTGVGFVLTVSVLSLAGYLSSMWVGSAFFDWLERQFASSAVTRGLYGAIRETLNAVMGHNKIFQQPVLVDFPDMGHQRVGFVTQEMPVFLQDGKEMVVVYVPHSFQISGNMFIVPKKTVKILNIPPELALKMIMSGGIVQG